MTSASLTSEASFNVFTALCSKLNSSQNEKSFDSQHCKTTTKTTRGSNWQFCNPHTIVNGKLPKEGSLHLTMVELNLKLSLKVAARFCD